MLKEAQLTALVTGGAGFLGYHLCARLLEDGYRVICMDDLSTGSPEHVAAFQGNSNYRFIHQDVCEPVDLRVDQIFNLACPASPADYQADPIKTVRTNVIGAMNLLELARRNGARTFQASTSEVYGDPQVHPQSESYLGNVNTTGPRACYDEGKRCAEALMYDFHKAHGVDIRIARIFNTYGPGMRDSDGRVVSNFIVQALRNQDITIYGNGSKTRSLCFVEDLIEGIVRLMRGEHGFSGPVNLGNPHEISILDFAHLVIEATGSRSRIAYLPEAIDDPNRRCPDISKAKAELGWEPAVSLEEGLQVTIDYFDLQLFGARSLKEA